MILGDMMESSNKEIILGLEYWDLLRVKNQGSTINSTKSSVFHQANVYTTFEICVLGLERCNNMSLVFLADLKW